MDAAQTTLKKTALFLALALLCLVPQAAWATTPAPTINTCGSITTDFSNSYQVTCAVSSTGGNVTYATSIQYNDSAQYNWLSVSPSTGTLTSTGSTLTINLTTLSLPQTTHSATITLSATDSSGAAAATISLTFTPNSGGGNPGSTITASPTSITLSPGGNLQTVNLTTTSVSTVAFTISAPTWLTVTQTTGTSGNISSSSPVTLSVYVNSFSSAAGSSSFAIIPNSGTSTQVNVFVTGAGGSGIISPSQTTVSWSYNTGGTVPGSQGISFTDTSGAPQFSLTVTTLLPSGDPTWLNIIYGGQQTTSTGYISFNGANSASFSVLPASNVIGSLSNGTHTSQVTIGDSSGNSSTVTVTLTINGSSTNNGLTANPGTITLPQVAAGSTNSVSASTAMTSTNSGTLSYSASGTCPGISGQFNNTSILANTSGVTFSVFGNPNGVSANTYNSCTLTVYETNSSGQQIASVGIPVTWVVGTGSTGGSNPVLPTTLNFAEQASNPSALLAQALIVSDTSAFTTTTPQYTGGQSGWLKLTPSSGAGNVAVSISNTSLAPGNYSATFTFNFSDSSTQAVTVNLLVSNSPVIYINSGAAGDITLSANNGTVVGNETFQVLASDGSSIPFTLSTSTSWLTIFGATTGNTPASSGFTVNPANLANGVYSGTITVTAATAANSPLTIPVILTVTGSTVTGGGGNLTFSTSSLTFNATQNGTPPQTQGLTVTANSGVTYSISANGSANGVTWLNVSPSGSISASQQNFTITVNQGNLPVGNYSGNLTFQLSVGGTQTVPITLNVTSSGGTNNTVTASPTTLSFSANANGTAPMSQNISLTSTSGTAGVNFNVSTNVQSGATNWLNATVSGSYTTPSTIVVSVNPTGLTAGTYTGTVVITPFNNGTVVDVTVTFVVNGLPQVSASPTSLPLAYAVGSTPPTGTISVSGNAGAAGLNYTATVTSTCNCIAISPAGGNTASNPAITVTLLNPTSLTAGNYTGTITVSGTNGSTGTTTVTVTLTVTAPLPTITSVTNSATGVTGPVAPGEIVSLFAPATNPIGPATGVSFSLVGGNVPTTPLAGVSVTFNGHPAALLYVSSTQINAQVPYEVAGFSNFPVIVTYLGQSSNGFTLQTTAATPGIFTQNSAGSGPSDVLNADGRTVNGPNTPAPRGTTVSVYMTGEGATTPKGVDGMVTCSAGCPTLASIPIPLLPVTVLVDGQPAQVTFFGEAPNLVSGVLQVNFTIPATARSGSVSLVVSVGTNQSQSNATIYVQ